MEESDTPEAELYDFLYRDVQRISSLYAQMFSGRLTSLERTVSEGGRRKREFEVALPTVAKGGLALEASHEENTKHIVDPHDLVTIDVLVSLVGRGLVHQDAATASQGSLVRVTGRLFLLDGSILKMADPWLDRQVRDLKKAGHSNDAETFKLVKEVFKTLDVPSHFLLKDQDGRSFAGTIKESGLEEPISAFYLKHGNAGLEEVHLIGIKEGASGEMPLEGPSLMALGQQVAKALSTLTLSADSTKLMPLAIFRTIKR